MGFRLEQTYDSALKSYLEWYGLIFKNYPKGIKIKIEEPDDIDEYVGRLRIDTYQCKNYNSGSYKKLNHSSIINFLNHKNREELFKFMKKLNYEVNE